MIAHLSSVREIVPYCAFEPARQSERQKTRGVTEMFHVLELTIQVSLYFDRYYWYMCVCEHFTADATQAVNTLQILSIREGKTRCVFLSCLLSSEGSNSKQPSRLFAVRPRGGHNGHEPEETNQEPQS